MNVVVRAWHLIICVCYTTRVNGFNRLRMRALSQYRRTNGDLLMRDGSTAAVFFAIGDKVCVTNDVIHNPKGLPSFSSKGLIGSIKDIWEKCEVDPHCCCAELAFEAPIEVEFTGSQYDPSLSKWTGFFAPDEIKKVAIDFSD